MENFVFKPVKLNLKPDLVSHPACVEGLGKYIKRHKWSSNSLTMACKIRIAKIFQCEQCISYSHQPEKENVTLNC